VSGQDADSGLSKRYTTRFRAVNWPQKACFWSLFA
jgi:hypothetical protein